MRVLGYCWFSNIKISQGSVATCLMCGGLLEIYCWFSLWKNFEIDQHFVKLEHSFSDAVYTTRHIDAVYIELRCLAVLLVFVTDIMIAEDLEPW